MAQQNLQNAPYAENGCGQGFGGIARNLSPDGSRRGCFDMCNFRLQPDGSLTARCGYARSLTLTAAPRAVWSGHVMGVPTVLALVGNTLWSLNISAGTKTSYGTVRTTVGDAAIFWYGGRLYVIDGYDIYCRTGNSLTSVNGYVPLYGDGWHPFLRGEVCEPKNLLSRKIRLRYVTVGETSELHFGTEFTSIDRIEINGVFTAPASFSYSVADDGMSIESGMLPTNGEITLWLTLPASECDRDRLTSCTRAVTHGDTGSGRIYCYGGDDSSEMFVSHPVGAEQLRRARLGAAGCSDMYFPETSSVLIGEGRYVISATSRLRDYLMVFTEGDAWLCDWDGDSGNAGVYLPRVRPLNSGIGCTSHDAAVLCGNDPVTVSGDGIYRWKTSGSSRDECSATLISEPLGELTAGIAENAVMYACPRLHEIWICNPGDPEGRLLIYNSVRDAFYTFTGIGADYFFAFGGEVGFIRGAEVYCFDGGRTTDLEADGEEAIECSVTSHYLDFSHPELEKHLDRIMICADTGGGGISAELTDGRGCTAALALTGEAGISPEYLEDRADIGSFRYLKYTVTGSGAPRLRLRGVCITARK